MKKIMTTLLAAILLATAAFTGCGKGSDPVSSSEPEVSITESTELSSETETSSSTPEESSTETEPEEESADSSAISEPEVSSVVSESATDSAVSEESAASSELGSTPTKPESTPAESSSESAEEPDPPAEQQPAGVSASDIYSAINSAFQSKYGYDAIPSMTMEVDSTTLTEKFHVSTDMVESYAGAVAALMTNCDELVVVQAKEGQLENVKAALEQALADQKEAFSWYAVMNNTERLESAKVVTKGNYAALLIVGTAPEDSEDEGAVDFSSDVSLAENAFFNAIQ